LYWLIDWDLKGIDAAKRRRFYRQLNRLLDKHKGMAWRSSQSVLVVKDKRLAIEIHRLCLKYGKANLYRCERLS